MFLKPRASTFEIKKAAHSMHWHQSRFPVLGIIQRHHGRQCQRLVDVSLTDKVAERPIKSIRY
jgi:hypothetical protein